MQALQRTKALLKKAQKLSDLIESNDELDKPERELMLTYLRDLHDVFAADTAFLMDNNNNTPPSEPVRPQPVVRNEPPPPAAAIPKNEQPAIQVKDTTEESVEAVVEKEVKVEKEVVAITNLVEEPFQDAVEVETIPTQGEPKEESNWDSLMAAAERFLDRHESPYKELPKAAKEKPNTVVEALPDVKTKNYVTDDHDEPATAVVIETPKIVEKPIEKNVETNQIEVKTGGLEMIFDLKASVDYGADKPIKDLRMAFGINERIFNINELFAGSASAYDTILNDLNGASNFEEAKTYLVEKVIPQYGWERTEKVKKAQWFARMVWRRFL